MLRTHTLPDRRLSVRGREVGGGTGKGGKEEKREDREEEREGPGVIITV